MINPIRGVKKFMDEKIKVCEGIFWNCQKRKIIGLTGMGLCFCLFLSGYIDDPA